MQRFRRFIPLATIMALGVVLFIVQPWSDDDTLVEEVAAGAIQYRLCNVSLWAPPQALQRDIIRVGRSVRWSEEGRQPKLVVSLREPELSAVEINPETGALLQEHYATAAAEMSLKSILNTKRMEPLDLTTAPWPYTDTVQIPAQRFGEKSTFEWRLPDPGSGIVVSEMYADGIMEFSHHLRVANCRSGMEIMVTFRPGVEPKVTVTKDIHPDDEAAFQAFYDQVTIDTSLGLGNDS